MVSPPLQLFAAQLPPENDPSVPQTCEPDTLYPELQLYEHDSPVEPLHVVGEFDSVSPLVQLITEQDPPLNAPLVPHVWDPPTANPGLHV